MFVAFFPEITQTVAQWLYIAADCCSQRDTVPACSASYRTAHLLYKYCTVCNWTVLTVITHKLLLHVQLYNSTAHLLYKYCTNCTVWNWTVLTVITHNLSIPVQPHNSTQTVQLMSSEVQYSPLLYIIHVSARIHSVISLDRTFQINATATKHSVTCSQHYSTHPTFLSYEPCVYTDNHMERLDPSNSCYWLQGQCRISTVIRNKWMLLRWLTHCANWRKKLNIFLCYENVVKFFCKISTSL
jgi:hypothetical protein